MASCAHRSTFLVISAFLLFSALTPVYGGGGRDHDLARVDALINEREYDQATLILTDFARRYPDRFDQAQTRLRRIYQIRDEFNRTADELIDTLLEDPDNDEKLLELSTKLFTLENETSPLLASFLLRTHEIAQFNVNRNQLRQILERGRELLDEKDGVRAIQIYASGMDFMRSEFFTANYGEEIESEVIRETERVNTLLATFQQASTQMESLSAELIRNINTGDFNRITQSINNLMPAVNTFIELKHELYTASFAFSRIFEVVLAIDP
ncbi:MAG: hypothetical protein LBC80_02110 [Treponema sp.]|jgi:hypothetical protein|nr:hypothetical protein [Treponema sp.]